MEYLGVTLEEKDAWVISAFTSTVKLLQEEKKGITLDEGQKTTLFAFFYGGVLYGENVAKGVSEMGG